MAPSVMSAGIQPTPNHPPIRGVNHPQPVTVVGAGGRMPLLWSWIPFVSRYYKQIAPLELKTPATGSRQHRWFRDFRDAIRNDFVRFPSINPSPP